MHSTGGARFSLALVVFLALAGAPARGESQHTGHTGMAATAADTLASAPTKPTRPTSDSAKVADSLLALCKPHVSHSIDAYSTCIGDGIASLSSAGHNAGPIGNTDYVIPTAYL